MRRRSRRCAVGRSCHRASEDRALECPADRYRHPLLDDLVADFGRFEVPHRYIATRPFNLVPLLEIAPDHVDPRLGKTIRDIAAGADLSGITRKARAMHFFANRQEEAPDVRLSLNRVGVSSVKHIIRLNVGGTERVFNADFTMVADLRPDKAGVHMSRFSELLEAATLEVLARPIIRRARGPGRTDRA